MDVVSLRLSGLKLFKPRLFRDERGYFLESYRAEEYEKQGLPSFVQDNLALSKRDTIRALHFQSIPGQAKLVTCLSGKIFDVVVDIRLDSPTFGEWEGIELEGGTHHQLFIPIGFAHGYCALTDETLVQYKVSAVYDPKTECSIRWNDPDIGVKWPTQTPLLSLRDQQSPFFHEVFHGDLDPRR